MVGPSPIHRATARTAAVSSATNHSTQILGRRQRAELDEEAEEGGAHDSTSGNTAASGPSPKRRRRANMLMELDKGEPSTRASQTVANGSRAGGEHSLGASSTPLKAHSDAARNPRLNGASAGVRHETYYGHSREEVTRILIQALNDLGYKAAADNVGQDSGFQVESPDVIAFRQAVLDGSWVKAEELLCGKTARGPRLVLASGADRDAMRFRLRRQKYLELLEKGDTGRALAVLRNELTPLCQEQHQAIPLLSRLLMCQDANEVKVRANWDGANGRSRQILLAQLSGLAFPTSALSVLDF